VGGMVVGIVVARRRTRLDGSTTAMEE